MKIIKLLFVALLPIFLWSCAPKDSADGAGGGGGGGNSLRAPVSIEAAGVDGSRFTIRFNTFGESGNFGQYFGVYYSLTPFNNGEVNDANFIAFDGVNQPILPINITDITTVYFLGASVDTNGNRSAPGSSGVSMIFSPPPVLTSAHAQGMFITAGSAPNSAFLYIESDSQYNQAFISYTDFTSENVGTSGAQQLSPTNNTYGGFKEYSFSLSSEYQTAENLYIKIRNSETVSSGLTYTTDFSNAVSISPVKAAPTINSITVVGTTVSIDFQATEGVTYNIYRGTASTLHQLGSSDLLATTSSSPVTFDCTSCGTSIAIAEVNGNTASSVMTEPLRFVAADVMANISANSLKSVKDSNVFNIAFPANRLTGAYLYYDTQPITDVSNATLLDTVTVSGEYIHESVAQIDNQGLPVTHYYALVSYITNTDNTITPEILSEPKGFDITSDINSFNLTGFSNINLQSMKFYNGSLMVGTGGSLTTYDPDTLTKSSVYTKNMSAGAGFFLQPDNDTLIFANYSTGAGYGVGTYNYSNDAAANNAILSLGLNTVPVQMAEDDTTIYLSVGGIAIQGVVRALKSTRDAVAYDYTTMIDGLGASPKIVIANGLLYYTTGAGIYTLPLDADTSATSPATPTLTVGNGADSDNIADFVVMGTNIYYITGGIAGDAANGELETGLYLSAEDGIGGRTTSTLATGLVNARTLSFVNGQLFWTVNYQHLYTLVIDATTGIPAVGAEVQSVADTRVFGYTVESVTDTALPYRIYLSGGQTMLELTNDYIHPVTPIPAAPVISVNSSNGGIVKLDVGDTQGIDYYEIYAGSNTKYSNEVIALGSVSINGLTVGTSYTIYVKACNMRGCSGASEMVTTVPTS